MSQNPPVFGPLRVLTWRQVKQAIVGSERRSLSGASVDCEDASGAILPFSAGSQCSSCRTGLADPLRFPHRSIDWNAFFS
jgi:hypothetical protein